MLNSHAKSLAAILAAASAAFSGIAAAADLGPRSSRGGWSSQPAYYPQIFRWTGFYAGIQGGYGWAGTDAVSTTLSSGVSQGFSYSTSGALGGIHAGYNWQTSNLVFGVETDLEASGIGGSGIGILGGGHVTNIDWLGSIRARAGLTTGNTLFYLTGGFAYGGLSVDRSAGAGFTPFIGASDWQTGWTLGGGIEHAFTPNVTARLEYRYTDLGQITYTSPTANLTDTSEITQSAIRAGLSFRF
jgi:outer membrane immunogenic protein